MLFRSGLDKPSKETFTYADVAARGQVGVEIDVKVLKFDKDRSRVSLGLKQLGQDPWIAIAENT